MHENINQCILIIQVQPSELSNHEAPKDAYPYYFVAKDNWKTNPIKVNILSKSSPTTYPFTHISVLCVNRASLIPLLMI